MWLWPTVMACVVMPYVVMAYIGMPYVVMAYIGMAYIVVNVRDRDMPTGHPRPALTAPASLRRRRTLRGNIRSNIRFYIRWNTR